MTGLDGKALTGMILVLPVFTDFHDLAAELVTNDGGVLCAVIGNALVVGTFNCSLVAGHAKAVGNDLDADIIGTNIRKLNIFQTQIHLAVDFYCFRFHGFISFS